MELIGKIIRFELSNAFRSKWIIAYSLFFFLLSYLLLSFETDSAKSAISMMNIVLIVIPLVSIIFGTIFVYNCREYIEMILCQPIDRTSLFLGLYLGNSIPLASGFLAGTLAGFLLNGFSFSSTEGFIILLAVGASLTFIFTAIAFYVAIKFSDKAKGLGFAIILWLILAVVYDGLILIFVYFFQEYPIDNTVLIISLLNPIDLGRILFILNFDVSALMGYTGALFNKFFGGSLGMILSVTTLLLWFFIPTLLGLRGFKKKDF